MTFMGFTDGKINESNFWGSYEMLEKAKDVIPAGENSTMRVLPYQLPLFIKKAEGVRIYDIEDNELIDLNMGYGPLIFGHRSPIVVNAIIEELSKRGTTLGFPHELSHQTAELIRKSYPSIEMLRFSSTGSEVDQTAVRLAKAYTGRDKMIVFEGHYHGSTDNVYHKYHVPTSELAKMQSEWNPIPGTAGMVNAPYNTAILPWNDIDVLKEFLARYGDQIAGIIMEPVMGNAAVIPPEPGYLQAVRELTKQYGIVLIFDEVITGYRVARGGAQERYGVQPDITTLSKAMNGGVPISAVGGSRKIMELLSSGKVFHGGVYSGNPMCLAATLEVQKEFDRNSHKIYDQLENSSNKLAEGIKNIFRELGIPVVIQNVGAMLNFTFVKDNSITKFKNYREIADASLPERYIAFQNAAQRAGIFYHPNQYEPMYLSTAHTDSVIEYILFVIEQTAKNFKW
jgi:glutamate-1-semialdehyde 2,1-aminomutase